MIRTAQRLEAAFMANVTSHLATCPYYTIVAAQGASPRLLQKFFVLFGTCTIWHLFNCVIPAANMPLDQ